ncbi:MAG: AAA family ATPase, partial [Capsulimonadaceae bacterium]
LSVVAIGNSPVIHADVGIGRKLPVAYLGDGVHRLLSIIIYMATLTNGTILIDEIDSGLHYSVLAKIWATIAKASRTFGCQVIGTTHSYECLTAAKEAFAAAYESDFSFIRLDRRGDSVQAKVYDYPLFTGAIDSDLELR